MLLMMLLLLLLMMMMMLGRRLCDREGQVGTRECLLTHTHTHIYIYLYTHTHTTYVQAMRDWKYMDFVS